MTVFSCPSHDEKSAISNLIFRCFPEDSPKFLSAVTDRVFSPEECLVAKTDGSLSAAVLLPRFSLSDGRTFGYVYCLCTNPSFRGQGIMRELLKKAESLCLERGDSFVALVPANPELAKTYAKMGYSPVTHTACFGAPSALPPCRRAGAEDIPLLDRLYEEAFSSAPHIRRDQKLWETLITLYSADGGGAFLTGDGYFFAEASSEGFTVRETNLLPPPPNVSFRLPARDGAPRVLAKGYSGDLLLLNLLFD